MRNTISFADLYAVAALVRGDIPWPMLFPYGDCDRWHTAFADYERWRNQLPSLQGASYPMWTTEYRELIKLLAPQLQGRQVQVITTHWLPFWITGCWKYVAVFGWPETIEHVTSYVRGLAIDCQTPDTLSGLARNQSVLWLDTQYAFFYPNKAMAPVSLFIEGNENALFDMRPT
jgi:hypothetical protein